MQQNWHEFTYPYFLANYRKTLLSAPVTMAVLDYYTLNDEQFNQVLQGVAKVETAGICHGLAIWVDYDLGVNGLVVRQFSHGDFIPHQCQSVRFLPTAICGFVDDGGAEFVSCPRIESYHTVNIFR